MTISSSLHTARVEKPCGLCGERVPIGGEYRRLRVARSVRELPRLVCALCFWLHFGDFENDPWVTPADGERIVTEHRPQQ